MSRLARPRAFGAISSIELALTVIGQRSFAASIGLRFLLRGSSKASAVHRQSARLDHVAVGDDVEASGPSRGERPLERRRDIRRVLDQFALRAETLSGALVMDHPEFGRHAAAFAPHQLLPML